MLTPTGGKGSKKASAFYPQVNARIDPAIHKALLAYLADPLLTTTPKGALAAFIEAAIRNELTRRGVIVCHTLAQPTSGTSNESSSTPETPLTLSFF